MTGIQQQMIFDDLESRLGFGSSAKRCRTPVWPTGITFTLRPMAFGTRSIGTRHECRHGDKVASGVPEPGSGGAQEGRKWCLTRDRGTEGAGPGLLTSLRPKVRGHHELSLRS